MSQHRRPRFVFWRCDWTGISCFGRVIDLEEGVDLDEIYLQIDGNGHAVVAVD